MQTLSITIDAGDDGKKIRSILKGRLGFSSHAIGGLTRTENGILLNRAPAFSTAIVHTGDTLTALISDRRPSHTPVVPCAVPLPIVWEDPYLLVVNKPAGMVSLASSFLPETPTVAGALAYQRGMEELFHVVNRLDKGTTGLMVVAKSGYVHNLLRRVLHSSDFSREYLAVCMGCPSPAEGSIDLPIGRDERSTVARMVRPDGAPSLSRYQVLRRAGPYALIRLSPETGRTHQLRVHMAAIGHPLAGDWLYGTEDPGLIPRPALHSHSLSLRHPVTGELLHLTAPLPEDMTLVLKKGESEYEKI